MFNNMYLDGYPIRTYAYSGAKESVTLLDLQ